jgi:DNA invertase Pin-like site-specific DNA recombinase
VIARKRAEPADPPHKRAIGYIRVSAVGGRAGPEYHTLDIQRASIERVCRDRGFELTDMLTDENRSGKSRKRPHFQEAMQRTLAGEADAIAVWKVSRFSRNWAEAAADTELLLENRKDLISGEEGFDTTTTGGRALLRMLFVLATWEHEVLGEGWEVVKAKAVRDRGSHLGNAPLGYTSGRGGVLIRDQETAPIVIELFERRAHGATWSQLADYLDHVHRGRRLNRRDRRDVERIITSRTYLGETRWRDQVNEGAHEPLVSKELWRTANSVAVDSDSRPVRRSQTRQFPLSGWLRCSGCGGPMGGSVDRDRQGRPLPNYKCSRRRGGCGKPQNISAPAAEAWAMAEADTLFTAAVWSADPGVASALTSALSELAEIETAIQELRSIRAKRELGQDWVPTMAAIRHEREAAESKVISERRRAGLPVLRKPWTELDEQDRWAALRRRAPHGAVVGPARRGRPPAERLGFIVEDEEADTVTY